MTGISMHQALFEMEGEHGADWRICINYCGNRRIFCSVVIYHFPFTQTIIFSSSSVYLHFWWYFIWNGCRNDLFNRWNHIIKCFVLWSYPKDAANSGAVYKP